MLGGEDVAPIFSWELIAVIERQFKRCIVRMEYDIGRYDFILELGMLSCVARILVFAHVPPGPAVKTAVFYSGNVVGDEVVAQPIAFIDRAPQRACLRLDREPNAIPNAIGIHAHCRAVWIELEDVGAILFRGSG